MPPPGPMVKRRMAKFGPSMAEMSTWMVVLSPFFTTCGSTFAAFLTVMLPFFLRFGPGADHTAAHIPDLSLLDELGREQLQVGGGHEGLLDPAQVGQQVQPALGIQLGQDLIQ